MKSIVVLAVAAAAFAFLLLQPYVKGREVIDVEEAARERLSRFEPGLVGGYRYEWVRDDALPDVFVARPEWPDKGGKRWFATRKGKYVFSFNTVRNRAVDGRTNLDRLRRFLALSADERKAAGIPLGWELLVHSR